MLQRCPPLIIIKPTPALPSLSTNISSLLPPLIQFHSQAVSLILPIFISFEKIKVKLTQSPLNKKYIKDIISRRYFKIKHQNEDSVDNIVDRYQGQKKSNRCFYLFVKIIENNETNVDDVLMMLFLLHKVNNKID